MKEAGKKACTHAALGVLLLPVLGLAGMGSAAADTTASSVTAQLSKAATASPSSAKIHLTGAIGRKWSQNMNSLGTALNFETCEGGVCSQSFQKGEVIWSPSTGARMVLGGDIRSVYQRLGAQNGGLGAPASDKIQGLKQSGQWQQFRNGGIYYHPWVGTHAVHSGLWSTWSNTGRENGALGYPISEEVGDGSGGAMQQFQNGRIYWTNNSPKYVFGGIFASYLAQGAENGVLGKPTGGEYAVKDGAAQNFEGGVMYWSGSTGGSPVVRGMLGLYQALGGASSWLGHPISGEHAVKGGSAQRFKGGNLYWAASAGRVSTMTIGDIKNRFDQLGAENGMLGLPVGNKVGFSSGYYQEFENAVLVWAPNIGAKYLDKNTFAVWKSNFSQYGWPTKDMWVDDKGIHTQFQNLEVIWQNGVLSSAEPVSAKTVVMLCDSQCDGDSWSEQGARANGYTHIISRDYGGGGYSAWAGVLASSVTEALFANRVNLPQGDPGLVMLTLGGNDATQGNSDAQIVSDLRRMILRIKQMYPNSKLVINGVMSRTDADHNRRRAVDALVMAEAQRQGISHVSVAGWGTTLKAKYRDNIHLSPDGHNTVAPRYAAALAEALLGQSAVAPTSVAPTEAAPVQVAPSEGAPTGAAPAEPPPSNSAAPTEAPRTEAAPSEAALKEPAAG
ncbi:LGFP repeat-containing protein [Arthrobacter alpinus]|uniref:LGFP repeat-containing protein n=1 Tax=Arthrobacter alpinus TaxID=656366 RepID=A0A1H5I9I1_9MICC|nr:GDSL-type esterase/lipase family protein [Arthrobacter alpinus]SEE36734.1 LGFP repeat-containing protein [Arthrobacter alpinus]